MMICPFCQSEVKSGFSEKLRKKIGCQNCHAFLDKDGTWLDANGLTVFDLRLQNLPPEASFQNITASNTGFVFKNTIHSYDLIQHLDFIWNHAEIQTSVNLVPAGKYHNHTSRLKVVTSDGSSFVQKAGTKGSAIDTHIIPGGLIRGTKKLASKLRTGMSPEKQCQELFIVSQIIHKTTFEQRAKIYLDSLQQQGSFEYGKFTFYDNSTVTDGKKLFDLRKTQMTRRAYSLELSQKPSNLRQKFMGNDMAIPLTHDRDVIHAIFSQVYKII